MPQVQIPLLSISERTTWREIPDVVDATINTYEAKTGSIPPLLIFEPYEESRLPGFHPTPSEAPEELIVIAVGDKFRQAVFEALERVAEREPKIAERTVKLPKFKENTPMKSFFRQMAEMPATVFSITFPDDSPDSATVFFLRTPFTVSEFRREMHRPIE